MTTIHNSLETTVTGQRGSVVRAIWQRVVSLYNRRQNRQSLMALGDFNDHQLADIGLTRDDLRYALRGGPFDDHSMDLMRAALRRRSRLYQD